MKWLYTFIALTFQFSSLMAQDFEIGWQNTIGGGSSESVRSVYPTSDGGCILAGRSFSDASGDKSEDRIGDFGEQDMWVVKLDSQGVIEWENTIGGDQSDAAYSVLQTSDGGYIIGGDSASDISGDKTEDRIGAKDYWVVKLNSSGVVEWDRTIGGTLDENFTSLDITDDGGFIIGGSSMSNISGDKTEDNLGVSDYWVVKLDSNGEVEWDNTIGGTDVDLLFAMQQTEDGGYILGGLSQSDASNDKTENDIGGGTGDYWIVKLDADGIIEWDETIGGVLGDRLFSIEQTNDGGYVIGGGSGSPAGFDKTEDPIGSLDFWIVKVDPSGAIEWDNTIGGNALEDECYVLQSIDGKYLVMGHSDSNISGDKDENSQGGFDYWVLKLDSTGVLIGQETIGGANNDVIFSMDYTSFDDSLFMVGTSNSDISGDKTENSNGAFDFWALKLINVLNVEEFGPKTEAIVFPNPAGQKLSIALPQGSFDTLSVFTIYGKKLNIDFNK